MKSHVRHVTLGGIVGPIALAIAAAIANEAQTLLGLHLQGEALAVFIAPFILGAALVLHGQLRLEAQRLLSELGSGELDLGGLLGGLGGLFGDPGGPPGAASPRPPSAEKIPDAAALPSPPPPAP